MLKAWLKDRPRNALLFLGKWAKFRHQSHWLKNDLKLAGISGKDEKGRPPGEFPLLEAPLRRSFDPRRSEDPRSPPNGPTRRCADHFEALYRRKYQGIGATSQQTPLCWVGHD